MGPGGIKIRESLMGRKTTTTTGTTIIITDYLMETLKLYSTTNLNRTAPNLPFRLTPSLHHLIPPLCRLILHPDPLSDLLSDPLLRSHCGHKPRGLQE
jgi:hypothetical protein